MRGLFKKERSYFNLLLKGRHESVSGLDGAVDFRIVNVKSESKLIGF